MFFARPMKYKYKFSIIVPAYNEKNRILRTLDNIYKHFQNQNSEIIIVDDGSTDNTASFIEYEKENIGDNIKIISYKPNKGKGYAVKKGVEKAQGEFILFTDADNSTPIEEFKKLFAGLQKGFDIAIGSRYLKNSDVKIKQNILRILIGRLGNLLIQLLLVKNIKDTQCGFKLFKNKIAKNIFTQQTIYGWGFDMEILAIAQLFKYKIIEIPVDWYNSADSKFSPIKDTFQTLSELIKIKINLITGKYKK